MKNGSIQFSECFNPLGKKYHSYYIILICFLTFFVRWHTAVSRRYCINILYSFMIFHFKRSSRRKKIYFIENVRCNGFTWYLYCGTCASELMIELHTFNRWMHFFWLKAILWKLICTMSMIIHRAILNSSNTWNVE